MHQSSYVHVLFFSVFIESFVIQAIDHARISYRILRFFLYITLLRKRRTVLLSKQYSNPLSSTISKVIEWLNFEPRAQEPSAYFIFSYFGSIESSRKQLEVFRHIPRVPAFAVSSIFYVGCPCPNQKEKTSSPLSFSFYEWKGKYRIYFYSTRLKSLNILF